MLQKSNSSIATEAQQTSDLSCDFVVVNMKRLVLVVFFAANSANASLSLKHLIVVFDSDAVLCLIPPILLLFFVLSVVLKVSFSILFFVFKSGFLSDLLSTRSIFGVRFILFITFGSSPSAQESGSFGILLSPLSAIKRFLRSHLMFVSNSSKNVKSFFTTCNGIFNDTRL